MPFRLVSVVLFPFGRDILQMDAEISAILRVFFFIFSSGLFILVNICSISVVLCNESFFLSV